MATSSIANKLSTRYIFGLNAVVNDNISFADDDNLSYVACQSIIQYGINDKRQRFIQAPEITDVITAYTSGPGKRLAAVAVRGEKPSVHVFDLRSFRKKKSFQSVDTVGISREFICIQFSQDEQLMLTLTGAPDYNLSVWNWSKAKLICSIQVSPTSSPIYKCSFSPIDPTLACVNGKNAVKFYRIAEKEARVLQENFFDDLNITCHCWMRAPDDHVLAATDSGQVLLFRSGEYVCHIPCSVGSQYPIYSIISIQGGFVCGSGPGTFLFFAYDEMRDQALFDNQFSLANTVTSELTTGMITALAVSPNEEQLCATTSDGQLLSMNITSFKSLVSSMIHYSISSFHEPKTIVGMDVASKKPLIVTNSKDNTLRVWNFKTHEVELIKHFVEEMLSVAIHPNGLHIAIGFSDKLRVFHLLVDDIRLCMEVSIKGCRELRFSKSGNFLAAAHGNTINIFDFHTGEKVTDLRGHNNKVKSLYWLESGCQLISCGQDGAVYIWDISSSSRIGEYVQKGVMYTSAMGAATGVFAVGSDRCIRELSFPDLGSLKAIDTGAVLSHVQTAINKSLLICAVSEYAKPSCIRAYSFPVNGDFDEYSCVSSQITRLMVTVDETFVIAVDDVGCIIVFEIKDKQDRYSRLNPTAAPELTELDDWNDDILITLNELEEIGNFTSELQTKVEELRLHNEYQLKLKEMNYSEKIKEITDKFIQELEQAKTKFELLKEERADSDAEYAEKIKQSNEQHENLLQEVETAFQTQIMDLVDGYQKLTRQRDAQVERLEEQRKQLVFSHECYVEEITHDFELKLDEEKQIRLQFEDEKTELNKELNELHGQLEDDIDTEIQNLRRVYEEKLDSCRESTLKYKGENGMMKKKYVVMQRELDDQKEEMRLLLDKEKELHDQVKLLEKEVTVHKKEIKSRDVTIGEKEKKIYELKKKNQELDKFKFVLDYKIRELKQQIEPRQIEILGMRDQIKKMDKELENYHKSNLKLDDMIGVLRVRIEEISENTKQKRSSAKLQESSISEFKTQVQLAIKDILSPVLLRESVEKLVVAHGSIGMTKPRIDPEIEGEYDRHKNFLSKSIMQLKNNLEDSVNHHIKSNNEIMNDNLNLISDINKQRELNRKLKGKVQADIGSVRSLMQSLGNALFEPQSSSLQQVMNPEAAKDADPSMLLQRNKFKIEALRNVLSKLESRNMQYKAYSKEILPPMDNYNYIAHSDQISDNNMNNDFPTQLVVDDLNQ